MITKREKLFFYLTSGVIIFAFSFSLFITPLWVKNEQLNKEINLSLTKLKKYLWLSSKKEYIQNSYQQFASALNLSADKNGFQVEALTELENIAKAANIRIVDIRPEPLIELKTEGTMEAHLKFIYKVENSLSLFEIKKFRLLQKPYTQALEGTFSILQSPPL